MTNTHMGQPSTNHVTLGTIGFSGDIENLEFNRIIADGRMLPDHFRVPKDKVLVVTNVDWRVDTGSPKGIKSLTISIQYNASKKQNQAYRNVVFMSTMIADKNGAAGKSESMTAGFVVHVGYVAE